MATFPSINPTYGQVKRSAPRVRAIQFGSGYQQRAHVWDTAESEGL